MRHMLVHFADFFVSERSYPYSSWQSAHLLYVGTDLQQYLRPSWMYGYPNRIIWVAITIHTP